MPRTKLYAWWPPFNSMMVLGLGAAVIWFAGSVATLDNHQNDSIRTVICSFETRTLANGQLTAAEKRQAIAVYTQALAAIRLPACD